MTTMTLNNEKNGIEIRFDERPIKETLEMLKQNGFRWHSQKKLWYAKQTQERMDMAQQLIGSKAKEEKISKKATEKTNRFGVKVGDVFVNSWGYEQTNIDFWQVVELKGQTQIILRAIKSEGRNIEWCQRMVKPVKDAFTSHYEGETIRKTVKGTTENPYCSMEHGLLYKTDWEVEEHETSYY